MDAFFCIVLSYLVLRYCWRSDTFGIRHKFKVKEPEVNTDPAPVKSLDEYIAQEKVDRAKIEAEKQRDRDIAELKKQGYTDELIATIIPIINNNQ